jgi:glycosyltransferase involved in cell wall biosynthesis
MRLFLNGRFLSQVTTGVQRMAREFTRALDTLIADGTFGDIDATLLVQSNARLGDFAPRGIRIKEVRGATGHVWEQFLLPRHISGGTLLNLGNTVPIVSLARSEQVAVVLHDLSYRIYPQAYRWRYRVAHGAMDGLLSRKVDPLITVSQSERETIGRLYPHAADRIVVAQNGSWMADQLEPVAVLAQDRERHGLYVGSLSLRKNVEGVLATAISLARERGLRFKMVGESNAILSEIATHIPDDLRHLIEFCGQVEDQASLKALYRGASFLLFPSFYEASALPPMEAMAQRCPVIVSSIPSLIERCGDAALYCDPDDLSSIHAAACRILDDETLRDTLIRRGEDRARHYTWRAQAKIIVAALRDRSR